MDFAFPDLLLGIEVEGGIWQVGRHQRPKGFMADCEKYNALTLLGWGLLRYTSKEINNLRALDEIRQEVAKRTELYRPLSTS